MGVKHRIDYTFFECIKYDSKLDKISIWYVKLMSEKGEHNLSIQEIKKNGTNFKT